MAVYDAGRDQTLDDDESRDLGDYACVRTTWLETSEVSDETVRALFDDDVLTGGVIYTELLDAIHGDGYELVAFGTADPDHPEVPDEYGGAPLGVFVYRGSE